MNRFFTLLVAASSLTAVGQVTYPYNPDGNADGDIAVGDLQDFLVTYGNPFSPSEIMVGDSSLTFWVEQLSQTVQAQQEQIDSLTHLSQILALGPTEHIRFHELEWIPQTNNGDTYLTTIDFSQDGFLRLNGSGQSYERLIFIIVGDTTSPALFSNEMLGVENFWDTYWSSQNSQMTIPINSNEKIILYGNSVVEEGTGTGKINLYWTPIQNSDEEPVEDNLGPCQGEFTVNYHGYDYELVEIGDQCWFAENLQTVQYNNGDSIPYEILGQTGFDFEQDPSRYDDFCVYGPYVSTSGIKSSVMRPWMGLAYSGFAAMNENLCPVGYRVPKTEDFQTLLGAPLNVSVNRGDLLDTPPWSFGTNLSGFSIRMHGNVTHTQCDDAGQRAILLTSDVAGDQNGSPYMNRLEAHLDGTVRIINGNSFIAWSHGGAIRCIKD